MVTPWTILNTGSLTDDLDSPKDQSPRFLGLRRRVFHLKHRDFNQCSYINLNSALDSLEKSPMPLFEIWPCFTLPTAFYAPPSNATAANGNAGTSPLSLAHRHATSQNTRK